MEINSIIKQVLFRYPIFGNIIANLDFKFTTKSVPAPAFTDGSTIYYKQQFLNDFNNEEKVFVISHEIFHIVLNHLFRNIGKDRDLLNYVEDAIINQLLIRDGLVMPEGLVYIEDALDYSVEELYLKFLPELNEIKEWMDSNTFHMELPRLEANESNEILNNSCNNYSRNQQNSINDESNEILNNSCNNYSRNQQNSINDKLNEILNNCYSNYSRDLQELMNDNQRIREELIDDFQEQLKHEAESTGYGKYAGRQEFPSVTVGKAAPLLYWQELLKQNLVVPDEVTTSFYEVEMDGIIRKEEKADVGYSESEIIIDSSGSMDMQKIKAILRECKNILSSSSIRVGFCDVQFYGWNEIRNESDIDSLRIIGRGGTDFDNMANSFSIDADNKIVITDGECTFPKDRPDILWIVINYYKPYCYSVDGGNISNKINSIFINESDLSSNIRNDKFIVKKRKINK